MSHTSTLISSPVKLVDDIKAFFGDDFGVWATLKKFSKYKPIRHTSKGNLTDQQRINARHGINIPLVSSASLLWSNNAWVYNLPGGSTYPWRLLDFNHYYHDAPTAIFQQAVGTSMSIDPINPNGVSSGVPIFVFQKESSYYQDRDFDASNNGYSSSKHNREDLLAYVLGSEDVIFGSTGSMKLYEQTTHLGVVAFDSNGTYKGEAWASVALSHPAAEDNNMTIVQISSALQQTLGAGTFYLIACARLLEGTSVSEGSGSIGGEVINSYKYAPAHSFDPSYPAKFQLIIANGDSYPFALRGVSTSNAVSSITSLTTSLWRVYVTVRITNNGGRTWYFGNGGVTVQGTFSVVGTRVYNGTQQVINTTKSANKSLPSAVTTVNANGYIDVTFQLDRIWAISGETSGELLLESGSVTINCSGVTYNGISLGEDMGSMIRITYSS